MMHLNSNTEAIRKPDPPILSSPAQNRILLQVCTAHFISHVHLMTLPALMPMLAIYFKATFVEVGMALTTFNIVSILVQAPLGVCVDRWGSRQLLISALLLGGLSFGSLAVLSDYGWLLLAMVCAGIANGVYHPADYALLSSYTKPGHIGRAFSIHTFFGFVGGAAAPLLLAIAQGFGTGAAFAAAGTLSGFGAFFLFSSGKPATKYNRQAPADSTPLPSQKILTPSILVLTFVFALLNLATSGIQTFSVIAMVRSFNVDLSFANATLTSFMVFSALGVLAGGLLADRMNSHGLVAAGAMALSAAIVSALAFLTPNQAVLFSLMTAIGFLSGIITPSRDLLVKAASSRGAEGRAFGIVATGFNIGGAISPLLFGWFIDNNIDHGIFGATAIFMCLIAMLTFQRRSPS